MKRRHFMKLGTAAGLTMLTPWSRHAIAGEALRGFEGPFWMTINLKGAWDSTLFCDPKGDRTDGSGRGPVNGYHRDDIVNLQVGNSAIPLAPGLHPTTGESYYHHVPSAGGQPIHFLNYLANRGVTIINGIDAGLTNHRSGEQLAMAGSTAADFPTLAALSAYHRLVDRDNPPNGPMPLLSFGGYDGTANLLPATRLNRLEVLGQVTRPDAIGPTNIGARIHGDARQGLIANALSARRNLLLGRSQLPSKAAAMSQLFVARSKETHVGRLLENFNFQEFESMDSRSQTLERQAYVALRAFEGGLAVGANLILNGWDTHSNNDRVQAGQMKKLFRALMYIKDQAEALNVAHRLNIVVGSDFGRTTFYNGRDAENVPTETAGKDHHSVTSWMTMLWGSEVENGIRVVGESDDAVIARGLSQELTPVAPGEGTVLTPGLIHKELRRLAGIAGTELDTRFPIAVENDPLRIWA